MIAVRADIRMGIASAATRKQKQAIKASAAVEEGTATSGTDPRFNTASGKQLLKDAAKARNLAEEAYIKQKAEVQKGKGGGRSY